MTTEQPHPSSVPTRRQALEAEAEDIVAFYTVLTDRHLPRELAASLTIARFALEWPQHRVSRGDSGYLRPGSWALDKPNDPSIEKR